MILRNYFNPFIFKNIFTIPLGFQSGFLINRNFNESDLEDVIFGHSLAKYIRMKNMIKELKSINNHFIHQTNRFNSEDGINAKDLKEIYLNTIFAPCPFGYINADTFRVMEVLESGCIH